MFGSRGFSGSALLFAGSDSREIMYCWLLKYTVLLLLAHVISVFDASDVWCLKLSFRLSWLKGQHGVVTSHVKILQRYDFSLYSSLY